MPTYSQSDLATRVLRDLGLIGAEEVPPADWRRRAISSSAVALAEAAEARRTSAYFSRPRVSLTTPWLMYSWMALLAMKMGVDWVPAG